MPLITQSTVTQYRYIVLSKQSRHLLWPSVGFSQVYCQSARLSQLTKWHVMSLIFHLHLLRALIVIINNVLDTNSNKNCLFFLDLIHAIVWWNINCVAVFDNKFTGATHIEVEIKQTVRKLLCWYSLSGR